MEIANEDEERQDKRSESTEWKHQGKRKRKRRERAGKQEKRGQQEANKGPVKHPFPNPSVRIKSPGLECTLWRGPAKGWERRRR